MLKTELNKNIIEKKRVAFFINSMGGGGAEKVVQLLLEQLTVNKDLEIVLILLENKITYQLPRSIEIIPLFSHFDNYLQKFVSLFWGALKLKKIIKKYRIQIIISFLERSNFINIIAKLLGSSHQAIISEHANPEYTYRDQTFKNGIVRLFLKLLYSRADKIIAVSSGVKKSLINIFRIKERKIQVIYNPCDINKIKRLSIRNLEQPWFHEETPIIITVGRLMRPKGQWQLIQAFAEVKRKVPSRLVIIGEGELKNQLMKLAKNLSVDKDITFLGWQKNPYKYMAHSTVFALTSLWESFGIVLVEAMVCGVPIVSFDCENGPREILNSGQYGVLVPAGNIKELTKVILNFLEDSDLRKKFAQKAEKRAQKFAIEDIAKEYKQCLRSL